MTCIRSLILLIALLAMRFAQAATVESCSPEANNRAEYLLIEARENWSSLLNHLRTFSSCDDGVLAEGYFDAVVGLLARKWSQFDVFASLSQKHPAFQRWAVGHIDASASEEDLKKVIRTSSVFISDMVAIDLCAAIRKAATDALTKSAQTPR